MVTAFNPYVKGNTINFITFLKRFYLFIFRERGSEGERGTETSTRGPHWGPGPQLSHVP